MPYTEVTLVFFKTLMALANPQNVITPKLQAGKPETSGQSKKLHTQAESRLSVITLSQSKSRQDCQFLASHLESHRSKRSKSKRGPTPSSKTQKLCAK